MYRRDFNHGEPPLTQLPIPKQKVPLVKARKPNDRKLTTPHTNILKTPADPLGREAWINAKNHLAWGDWHSALWELEYALQQAIQRAYRLPHVTHLPDSYFALKKFIHLCKHWRRGYVPKANTGFIPT